MGNLCTCLAPKPAPVKKKPSKRLPNPQPLPNSSNRWTRIRSSRKDKLDDSLLHEQALAAAILFQQHHQNGSLPFDRSASLRYPNSTSKLKKDALPRSSSSRSRSLTDPLLQPHQLVNQVFGFICSSFYFIIFGCCYWNFCLLLKQLWFFCFWVFSIFVLIDTWKSWDCFNCDAWSIFWSSYLVHWLVIMVYANLDCGFVFGKKIMIA